MISIPDIKISSIDEVKKSTAVSAPNPLFYSNTALYSKLKTIDLPMPEIAESIDDLPENIDAFNVIKPDEEIRNSQITDIKLTPKVQNRFYSLVENVMTKKSLFLTTVKIPTSTRKNILTTKTQTRSTPRPTTRKNFRKDNDYYAMYYDQN